MKIKISKKKKYFLQILINKFFKIKRLNSNSMTSCLSRALTGRIVFDIYDIDNEIHLIMTKSNIDLKIPHAKLYSQIISFDKSRKYGEKTKGFLIKI